VDWWSTMRRFCGECVHRRLLALLPERHICAIRGPAVALRFTAG
jgi:hypothetical protein